VIGEGLDNLMPLSSVQYWRWEGRPRPRDESEGSTHQP